MKSFIAASCLVAAVALSAPAFAAGNSTPGIDRYNEISQHPNDNAQCGTGAGSGAFGYFGKDNNLGIKSDPTDPGADGQQTGINNSSLCGNRQSNP